MLLNLLVSLCCVCSATDTLETATISSTRNAAALSVSPTNRLSDSEIEKTGISSLHQALNLFSGVSIKDYGGIGGLKTVSVRNIGASHTTVVYDGIPVSDAQNGQVDISRFNLDGIGSVSMSIGTPDNIFCSARNLFSAGTLNLESYTPSFQYGPTEISANLSAASFCSFSPYVSIKQRIGRKYSLKAAVRGSFSRGDYPFTIENGNLETTEKRLNSDVKSYGAEADFRANWGQGGKMKAKVNYLYSDRGLPGSIILYTQNAYERLWSRSLISNISYDNDFGEKWAFHADVGFTYDFNRHIDTDPIYPKGQESLYTQNEYSTSARVMFRPSPSWKIVLAEDIFVNTLDSNLPDCPFPVRLSSATALSAEFLTDKINVRASLAGLLINERLTGRKSPENKFRLSPIVGISWNFYGPLYLKASFKEGLRAPTFNDLYYSRIGNSDLKPEIARQSNLGLLFSKTYDWGLIDLGADGYYNFIKDKIVAVPTMFIWRMRNFGKVGMWGTDLKAAITWRPCRWMTAHISGNYSLQYAVDLTDPEAKNYRHQIPYTPRHCGNGSLTLETSWLNISYRVTAVGKRYFLNQNIPANEIDGYADHCLSINRSFEFGKKHRFKIYAGVEGQNLGGRNYEVIRYYPMPGRSLVVTIKFKYK